MKKACSISLCLRPYIHKTGNIWPSRQFPKYVWWHIECPVVKLGIWTQANRVQLTIRCPPAEALPTQVSAYALSQGTNYWYWSHITQIQAQIPKLCLSMTTPSQEPDPTNTVSLSQSHLGFYKLSLQLPGESLCFDKVIIRLTSIKWYTGLEHKPCSLLESSKSRVVTTVPSYLRLMPV